MKYLKTYIESLTSEDKSKKTKLRFKTSAVEMSLDDTINYIMEHCKEWIENPVKISRGIDSKTLDYFYSKPVRRFSRDNSNFYTLIMDNSLQWKSFPKRSKSFICRFNQTYYGNRQYIVIPEDGSKWGVFQNIDIWYSFSNGLSKYGIHNSIRDFFDRLSFVSEYAYNIKLSDTNWVQFKKDIKLLDDKIKIRKKGLDEVVKFLNIVKNSDKSLMNYLLEILNPEINDIKLLTISEMPIESEKDYECWTDSPCVFINESELNYETLMAEIYLKKINNGRK